MKTNHGQDLASANFKIYQSTSNAFAGTTSKLNEINNMLVIEIDKESLAEILHLLPEDTSSDPSHIKLNAGLHCLASSTRLYSILLIIP